MLMSDEKKYVLHDTAGLIFGLTEFPPTLLNPEDDYEISSGVGIGMRVHLSDADVDPVVVMDPSQAKALVKALKFTIKDYRRGRRRWSKKSY